MGAARRHAGRRAPATRPASTAAAATLQHECCSSSSPPSGAAAAEKVAEANDAEAHEEDDAYGDARWVRNDRHSWTKFKRGDEARSWTPHNKWEGHVDGLVHMDDATRSMVEDHATTGATLFDGRIRARGRRETRLF